MSDGGSGETKVGVADAPPKPHHENEDESALKALAVSGALVVGVLATTVALLWMLSRTDNNGPEAALSLVFVATAVVLILVVCTLTIVFKRLHLSRKDEPMGLPSGSVRSVIALLLIMLFFISAIFLFNSTKAESTEARELTGITSERFAEIPTNEIEKATSRSLGTATVYDVTLAPSGTNTTTSDDIAKQLVTTVATLVTAVAAFYFGANTVSAAHKEAPKQTLAVSRGTLLAPVPSEQHGTVTNSPDTG